MIMIFISSLYAYINVGMVRFCSLGNLIYPTLPYFTQLQMNTNMAGKVSVMEYCTIQKSFYLQVVGRNQV